MARFAILSDIHSNLEALETVLAKCSTLKIDAYVCLGDVVGYNGNPVECIEKVRALKPVAMVLGNHDAYVCSADGVEGFNPNAKLAVNWTREQLSKEQLQWLKQLKYRQTVPGSNSTIVHATLDSPENWGYIFDVHHAQDNFTYQYTAVCFCGHSHVPQAFCKKPFGNGLDSIDELTAWNNSAAEIESRSVFGIEQEFTVSLKPAHKYLFNVGSIGQPRNHDPRASFAVYDTDVKSVTRFCLPYDIETTQAKIRAVGLPERLAKRLADGV